MDRIPLRSGKSTPEFVDKTLAVFGKNPHGEPNYRLIWSERKMIYFDGEMYPEYEYLPNVGWILERWIDPVKDAGPEALWNEMQEALMGPYPRKGTYNFVEQYPKDWQPTDESVRLIAVGLEKSRELEIKEREDAIRKGLEEKAKAARQKVADEIVELQDSASLGKIQQSVSGPKNTFRTPDDFGRDFERTVEYAHLPKSGGKLLKETE